MGGKMKLRSLRGAMRNAALGIEFTKENGYTVEVDEEVARDLAATFPHKFALGEQSTTTGQGAPSVSAADKGE